MLIGIFRSQKKPTYNIFDRIITYMCHQFNSIPDWNGMRVLVKVVNSSCDDQVSITNLKNASSAAKKGTNSKEALQGGGDGANPAFN
uniref:Uncharacterized protein n=1 Tax=Caenorhabditis japonica TaxID=281687 RepID=A0A8R1EV42_CAEJA